MTDFRRYAVYWAPPAGSGLARFAASWLGWDAEEGIPVPQPSLEAAAVSLDDITAEPRKYGFHGTLKAPFRLAPGMGAAALDRAVETLAGRAPPFQAPPLALARLGRFAALVPSEPCRELDDLAVRVVTQLDTFRAPPTPAEIARRRASGLTPRQEELLARWGYPYVLDEFRFHLTLAGQLPDEAAGAVLSALEHLTRPFCSHPLPIRDICLFGEGTDGRFRLVRRYRLAGCERRAQP